MMEQVRSWYDGHSRQEKIIIMVLAIMSIVVIGFFLIAKPLWQASRDAETRYYQVQADAAQIDARLDRLEQLPVRESPSGTPVAQFLAASASQRNIAIQTRSANTGNGVTVNIAAISPTALLDWLAELETNAIVPASIAIQPAGGETVSVRAELVRRVQ